MLYLMLQHDGSLTCDYFQYGHNDTDKVYCYGTVKKGDYLMSCPLQGIAMYSSVLEGASAIALEDKNNEEIFPIQVQWIDNLFRSQNGVLISKERKYDTT